MSGLRDDAQALRDRALAARERAQQLRDDYSPHETLTGMLGALSAATHELEQAREKIRNLEIALQTNRRIGMAIGIVMARRCVSEDQAFDILRSVSQRAHRKLRDVAEQVVYTGDLPGAA